MKETILGLQNIVTVCEVAKLFMGHYSKILLYLELTELGSSSEIIITVLHVLIRIITVNFLI